MSKPVRKAVLPVAGLGTRFLPATKVVPKEMLPIVDRPLIQMVVDEARAAGIEQFIFVTGRNKAAIEDHFDTQFELEATLRDRNQSEQLKLLERDGLPAGSVSFTRQRRPLGLGHAIWCARNFIGDEPFAVLLPDMIIKSRVSCLRQLLDAYESRQGSNILAIERVPWENVSSYGVIAPAKWSGPCCSITGMVEKPSRADAPSNFIISGRYVLQPEIFDILSRTVAGSSGEIQVTDAMLTLMQQQQFHGLEFDGTTFDCGSKTGFVAANLAYALDHPDLASDIRAAVELAIAEAGGAVAWEDEIKQRSYG